MPASKKKRSATAKIYETPTTDRMKVEESAVKKKTKGVQSRSKDEARVRVAVGDEGIKTLNKAKKKDEPYGTKTARVSTEDLNKAKKKKKDKK